ncbi:unnamed protein product [Dovyalis caffra]|uniref:Uncharacterized protein n=1 Tax=Dovyalis caffra TaxID=77055 RepID=A0AAV1SG05_9ROSI|nr:unnamed protein product [Dovyalis caffra]
MEKPDDKPPFVIFLLRSEIVGFELEVLADPRLLTLTLNTAQLNQQNLQTRRMSRQTAEVTMLAFEDGKNLNGTLLSALGRVLVVVDKHLGKSHGIQRTRELAAEHANLAAPAIDSLPETDDEKVRRSRKALVDLTQIGDTKLSLSVLWQDVAVFSENIFYHLVFPRRTKEFFLKWGFDVN